MDFKQIIKQEWEKEFPLGVDEQPAIFGKSIFESVYQNMVERICIQVWNNALEVAADNADADVNILTEEGQYELQNIQSGYDYEAYVLKESILKFKI